MNPLDEHTISCPYCGELLEVLIDEQEAGQRYIEDCQVCCRPIIFHIQTAPEGSLEVTVYREDDA
ncbi:MAG: CPXCG motif-containing cysteine-rich protein [Candidatus Thiodiazotropha sp.]